MTICYDGKAFRRVLAMKSAPEQSARAALALTRIECVDPNLQPLEALRELWLFRKDSRGGWNISVLPPATTNPDLGVSVAFIIVGIIGLKLATPV